MIEDMVVALLVLRLDGQYLFIRRNDVGLNAGKWELPKAAIKDVNDIQGEAHHALRRQVLGDYRVASIKRFGDFSMTLDWDGALNRKIKFICYLGDLDIGLVTDEYEDRLIGGPDHQAIALFNFHETERVKTTPEADRALMIAIRTK